MADAKISALPSATTPLAGTEVLPIVQSSTTRKVAVSDLTAGRNVSMADLTTTGNTVLGNASTDTLNVGNGDIVKDASGNFGFGVTPSAWTNSYKVIQTQSAFLGSNDTNNILFGQNVYVNAGNYIYRSSNFATYYSQGGGTHKWFYAPSGTINNICTFTQAMGTTTDGYLLVGYLSSNGAYRLQVNSQIFATSATIATSDLRYKENIQPLDGALDLVCALQPMQFSWKEHPVHNFDRAQPTVGFGAQQVQQVLAGKPYLNAIVKTNTCTIVQEEKDENGKVTKPAVTEEFLGIAEGNLIALLTAAIQEQQTLIKSLSARVAALEARKA